MFYVRANDQTKLAVYDNNALGKDTVFLMHGWLLSHKIFEYRFRELLQRDYRVVSMDLRGFGASDTPSKHYNYNQMADDIYTVVRFLNLTSFTLVGFSMGGGIVTRYMGRYHGYGVKKLIYLAAAAPKYTKSTDFPYGVAKANVDAWIDAAATDRPQLVQTFGQTLWNRPHSEAVKNWFRDLALSASGIATVETAKALRDEDCREDMAKIQVPTGIFHGQKDKVVPFELAEVQQAMIKDADLFPLKESGHGIFYDNLEEFNKQFFSYLEGK